MRVLQPAAYRCGQHPDQALTILVRTALADEYRVTAFRLKKRVGKNVWKSFRVIVVCPGGDTPHEVTVCGQYRD